MLLSNQGVKMALDKDRTLKTLDVVIDRISSDTTSAGNIYYLHAPGVPHLFTGGAGDWPKLPVTEKGDKVHIGYYDSDRDVLPLHDFDNLSLVLSQSKDQAAVRANVTGARQGQEAAQDASTVRSELQGLSDKQLQELKTKIPKQ
jgi:hypothetical protein